MDFEYRTKNQAEKVLYFFSNSRCKKFTPSEVHSGVRGFRASPITSIRRAFSDLTKEGKLCKTAETKIGRYGRPEHFWVLSNIKHNNQGKSQ